MMAQFEERIEYHVLITFNRILKTKQAQYLYEHCVTVRKVHQG